MPCSLCGSPIQHSGEQGKGDAHFWCEYAATLDIVDGKLVHVGLYGHCLNCGDTSPMRGDKRCPVCLH